MFHESFIHHVLQRGIFLYYEITFKSYSPLIIAIKNTNNLYRNVNITVNILYSQFLYDLRKWVAYFLKSIQINYKTNIEWINNFTSIQCSITSLRFNFDMLPNASNDPKRVLFFLNFNNCAQSTYFMSIIN